MRRRVVDEAVGEVPGAGPADHLEAFGVDRHDFVRSGGGGEEAVEIGCHPHAVDVGHIADRSGRPQGVEVEDVDLARAQVGDVEAAGAGIDVLVVEPHGRP